MAALTNEEKSRCRYHLGYLASSFAAAFQLGIPRPVQTVFLLESAMSLLTEPFAVARVQRILSRLDNIEDQLEDPGVALLYAEQLGELKLRGAEAGKTSTDLIEKEVYRWVKRLADILGVPVYPYGRWGTYARGMYGSVPRGNG